MRSENISDKKVRAGASARYRRPYFVVKRVCDFMLAAILLIPAMAVIGLCCVAIKMETNAPVFYIQERPGLKGKIFRIIKLRTMIMQTERDGRQLTDMERMTRTGRIIRMLSMDELPQIFNILRGEMSFIGPRPLHVNYLLRYNDEQMRRHDVLPGISGWAQVNGLNAISWEKKFELDVWYVDHVCAMLDIRIFLLTIKSMVIRQGINAGTQDTMEEFIGSEFDPDTGLEEALPHVSEERKRS